MRVPVPHMAQVIGVLVLWVVAAAYAWGALVHLMNMAGLSGFDWQSAPLKWKVLDVLYLVLDAAVAVGLPRRSAVGIVAFYLAALSQIALYTLGRDWILDVPDPELATAASGSYLTGLVIFHLVTLAVVTIVLRAGRRPRP